MAASQWFHGCELKSLVDGTCRRVILPVYMDLEGDGPVFFPNETVVSEYRISIGTAIVSICKTSLRMMVRCDGLCLFESGMADMTPRESRIRDYMWPGKASLVATNGAVIQPCAHVVLLFVSYFSS